jgi:hypothetical protein
MCARQGSNRIDYRPLARRALAELDADEPNRASARLLNGEQKWDDPMLQHLVSRDPTNARAMRPHLVAACLPFNARPALGLRCRCGKPISFVALVAAATGVTAMVARHRKPGDQRDGGIADLVLNPADRGRGFLPLEGALRPGHPHAAGVSAIATDPQPARAPGPTDATELDPDEYDEDGYPWHQPEPLRFGNVVGDYVHRICLPCRDRTCHRAPVLTNVQLVRQYLQAVANGDNEVRLETGPAAQTFGPG